MPKYNYVCSNVECGKEYSETRSEDDPLFYPHCNCGSEFNFVSEETA